MLEGNSQSEMGVYVWKQSILLTHFPAGNVSCSLKLTVNSRFLSGLHSNTGYFHGTHVKEVPSWRANNLCIISSSYLLTSCFSNFSIMIVCVCVLLKWIVWVLLNISLLIQVEYFCCTQTFLIPLVSLQHIPGILALSPKCCN